MGVMVKLQFLAVTLALSVNGLEVNLIESFNLKDGINNVQSTSSCRVERAFFFGKTKKDIVANGEILEEVADLLTAYKSFMITFDIQAEPFHKGTLVWLDQKSTGIPWLGLCVRLGKTGKVGVQFHGKRGTKEIWLEHKAKYDTPEWHKFVLHFRRTKRGVGVIDLYIDCAKVDTQRAEINLQNAPKTDLELRLAQRGVAGKIFARFKGSIGNFRLVFRRNVTTYTHSSHCNSRSNSPPIASDFVGNFNYQPTASHYARAYSQRSFSTTNQLSSLINSFQNAENGLSGTNAVIKEILSIVQDVNVKQDNQIYEMKSLKELLQILGSKNQFLLDDSTKDLSTTDSSDNPCQPNPCYPFVTCKVVGKSFKCGNCPLGLEGNGVNCTDVNECEENPCSAVTKCENKVPGFFCHACPKGFRGDEMVGIGRNYAKVRKQECVDIDECAEGISTCDKNAICKNTEGSFECGDCKEGFKKDRHGTCLQLQMCDGKSGSRKNPCSVYATCQPTPMGAKCVCRAATAGDGYTCGNDRDGDGYPDKNLKCNSKFCKRDNCPFVPNSGQEDQDGDGKGDACDTDVDGDEVYNVLDNCPTIPNKNQANSDKDGFGDVCDNCMFQYNPDQKDTDGDQFGDACDKDIDGDGIPNIVDNCATVANKNQMDRDRDGNGDACDNCPDNYNPKQENKDGDAYGDECDNDVDTDKDGLIDKFDNCPYVANANQLDIDGDGKGDECDKDKDNDGTLDTEDNCKLISNPLQKDSNGNKIGDKCEYDYDGDGYRDNEDTCPNNKMIHNTDFRESTIVMLAKNDVGSHKPPRWLFRDRGREVIQEINSAPSLLLSKHAYQGFDMTGTMFVNTQNDDDFVGFAFGFQNTRNFYLLSWKQKGQSYWRSKPSFLSTAKPGIELKHIKSATGPGFDLRAALWHSGNVTNQITELWHDKRRRGWDDQVPYRFELMHRPAMALIRLKVYRFSAIFVDTGFIIHDKLNGGKLGPYSFSQASLIWSDLNVKCNDALPEELLQAMTPKG